MDFGPIMAATVFVVSLILARRKKMLVHVRYDGRSYEFSPEELGVEPSELQSDVNVLSAVARQLELDASSLNGYVVDRNPETGNIVLRPQAVFG